MRELWGKERRGRIWVGRVEGGRKREETERVREGYRGGKEKRVRIKEDRENIERERVEWKGEREESGWGSRGNEERHRGRETEREGAERAKKEMEKEEKIFLQGNHNLSQKRITKMQCGKQILTFHIVVQSSISCTIDLLAWLSSFCITII